MPDSVRKHERLGKINSKSRHLTHLSLVAQPLDEIRLENWRQPAKKRQRKQIESPVTVRPVETNIGNSFMHRISSFFNCRHRSVNQSICRQKKNTASKTDKSTSPSSTGNTVIKSYGKQAETLSQKKLCAGNKCIVEKTKNHPVLLNLSKLSPWMRMISSNPHPRGKIVHPPQQQTPAFQQI